jgi:c-di-GMP-binding flagellar brake protein YcgR
MKRVSQMENPPSTPGDKRASERSHEKLLVSYTISNDLPAEYTETYDIATGGLAMLTNAELTVDLELLIELELRGGPRPKLRLNGNVRWSTYDALLQKYRTGVAFTAPSPEHQSELLRYIDTLHHLRTG